MTVAKSSRVGDGEEVKSTLGPLDVGQLLLHLFHNTTWDPPGEPATRASYHARVTDYHHRNPLTVSLVHLCEYIASHVGT